MARTQRGKTATRRSRLGRAREAVDRVLAVIVRIFLS
jgi:hypothetical protein